MVSDVNLKHVENILDGEFILYKGKPLTDVLSELSDFSYTVLEKRP